MSGSIGSTLAVSLNPFVGGFDWWGFIGLTLVIAIVAIVTSLLVWAVVGWFASDRLLVDGSTRNNGRCHGRALNSVSRGLVAGVFMFIVLAAGLGSLIVHTERVESSNAASAAASRSADQVDQLQQQLEDEADSHDAVMQDEYSQWLGLLGFEDVVDIDTEAQTATVVFPTCRRVIDLSDDLPEFVISDDGNGNVDRREVQHILILQRNAALDQDDAFRACFPEELLDRIAAAAT